MLQIDLGELAYGYARQMVLDDHGVTPEAIAETILLDIEYALVDHIRDIINENYPLWAEEQLEQSLVETQGFDEAA